MIKFKDFGIKTEIQSFVGDKIKMDRILNRVITVLAYRIENSKYEGKGKRLDLQIKIGDITHVVFTGSVVLMDQIQKVPKDSFPFETTVVKENERFEFT